MLTEIRFSQMGVRYIAVNDSVDTLYANNDMMAFVNLFNEWHPRETSKKIRVVTKVRAELGERIGTRPPYGYAGVIIGINPKSLENTGFRRFNLNFAACP